MSVIFVGFVFVMIVVGVFVILLNDIWVVMFCNGGLFVGRVVNEGDLVVVKFLCGGEVCLWV